MLHTGKFIGRNHHTYEYSEIENQLLTMTASDLNSNAHEKGVAGHSTRHRLNTYTDCSLSNFLVAPLFSSGRPRNYTADF